MQLNPNLHKISSKITNNQYSNYAQTTISLIKIQQSLSLISSNLSIHDDKALPS